MSKIRHSRKKINGASLIELLVVISIFVVIGSIVTPAVGDAFELFDLSETALERGSGAEEVAGTIRHDLRCASSLIIAGDTIEKMTLFDGTSVEYRLEAGRFMRRSTKGEIVEDKSCGTDFKEVKIELYENKRTLCRLTIEMLPIEEKSLRFASPKFETLIYTDGDFVTKKAEVQNENTQG